MALAILAVIATFTIPKILQSHEDSKRQAILKEAYAAISEITYQGVLLGELNASNFTTYFPNKLNAVKICTNAQTQGCWPGATDAATNTATAPGVVLANGAMIDDFETNTNGDGLWIDWNGTDGPNQMCDDQIPFLIAWTTGTQWGGSIRAGRVYIWTNPPFSSGGSTCPDSTYSDLFQ